MTDRSGTYTVTVRKGEEPGTVVGTCTDGWGWEIAFTASWDAARRGYIGQGTLGPVPEALRVAGFDSADGKAGGAS